MAYTDGSVANPTLTRLASVEHNRGGTAWLIKDREKKAELMAKEAVGLCVHPMLTERFAA